LAASVRRADPRATLNPTALVNEAWMKLAGSPRLSWASPLHFKRIAGRAMRQLLVESARRRQAQMRSAALVTFDEQIGIPSGPVASEAQFLLLDGALEGLSRLNARQASIVEIRFFAGLGVEETAQALGVSEATVNREWRAARAWLGREMRRVS
jgi:RNA polymerase sigma factor (TIGR02999 family)